ncbi:MAG: DUF2062 domain-containing protein [Chitinophagaceae bacterium]
MTTHITPEKISYATRFRDLNACVLIPTYNNAATLQQVITDVFEYTTDIIVVNDGSTDRTDEILHSFSGIHIVSYCKNVGKGWALRKGFRFATELGYDFAISIDSDGQHFAKDLPAFIDKLHNTRNAIIIGARNMDQASVPGKSSFGHKFSNFWFKFETCISCPDTQSGYRLYPLWLLKSMRFFTWKYEFEIEVLVRAAWKGIKIDSVPVTVYYAPKETRVSHFRPFKDFTRVSILNTVLVVITLLYIKPRDFLRAIFTPEKFRKLVVEHLFNPHQSDSLKASSIAFGIFMGIVPIWGFQLVAAIFLAVVFRLNKALVIIAANISIPPMIPLIIFASFKMGALWIGNNVVNLRFDRSLSLNAIRKNLEQYIYGSISLAVCAALVIGTSSFILLKIFKRKSVLAR